MLRPPLKTIGIFSAGLICGLIFHWMPSPSVNAFGGGGQRGGGISGGGIAGGRCIGDIAPQPNGNGFVNVDDLLAVINHWGACPIADADGDGVADNVDNCPFTPNPSQMDSDNDLHGDVCDNCPFQVNIDQADCDHDGIGDVCDSLLDTDGDGVANQVDNCWFIFNPSQADTNMNGIGDACDNTNDSDGDGITIQQGDCDDNNPAVYPGHPEICDGLDNDCNWCSDDGCP